MKHEAKKKVLLIGSSGAVGMATRDAIAQHLGADVLCWDRPATTPDKIADRAKKVEDYNLFVSKKDETLDGKQAAWLLRSQGATATQPGNITQVDDIKKALEQGVDCVAIAAGVPRKSPDEKRDVLIGNNVAIFAPIADAVADVIIEKLKKNEHFRIPVFINAGNPMDTMTEIFGRLISGRIEKEARAASAAKDFPLARRLSQGLHSLKNKIIGQGGVLDGARAAFAISEAAGIPINEIIDVPVIGTHNEHMTIDFSKTKVLHKGQEISLKDYPGFDLDQMVENNGKDKDSKPQITLAEKITRLTRTGGSNVLVDYTQRCGKKQSALLATGVAVMKMVDAVIHDRGTILPAAVYNLPNDVFNVPDQENGGKFNAFKAPKGMVNAFSPDSEYPDIVFKKSVTIDDGVVMGQLAKLGYEGVTQVFSPNAALLKTDSYKGMVQDSKAAARSGDVFRLGE